jgi:hypothetical protein
MHQIPRYVLAAILLSVFAEGTAYAQLEKRFAVGVSIVRFEPEAPELSTKVKVVPTIGRVPRPGWSVALALNWVEADVNGGFAGLDARLGRLNARPFMGGIGYTAMWGPFSINPSIVAGPSWNTFEIDDAHTGAFAVGGDDFDTEASVISFAVRPGISATYAITPRFGVTAFAGYLFNRPEFKVRGPLGETSTEWKADGLSVSAGIVVPVF